MGFFNDVLGRCTLSFRLEYQLRRFALLLIHIPLLQGRLWQPQRCSKPRLAVVNKNSSPLLPQWNVIGPQSAYRLQNHPPEVVAAEGGTGWLPIIGVVGDVRNDDIDKNKA